MSNTNKNLIEKHNQMIVFLKNTIEKLENDLKRMKIVLNRLENFDTNDSTSLDLSSELETAMDTNEIKKYEEDDMQIVEGKYDWYFMIWPEQKKYPVHPNYSSKTKLVAGDVLKLRILPDGKFIFKLIKPAERKHIKATLSKNDEWKFIAVTEDEKIYFLNQAAVTFFSWTPWDKIYILINAKEEYDYAAIEAIVKN